MTTTDIEHRYEATTKAFHFYLMPKNKWLGALKAVAGLKPEHIEAQKQLYIAILIAEVR